MRFGLVIATCRRALSSSAVPALNVHVVRRNSSLSVHGQSHNPIVTAPAIAHCRPLLRGRPLCVYRLLFLQLPALIVAGNWRAFNISGS